MLVGESPLYEDLLDILADSASAERIFAFQLSAEKQLRLEDLLQKNRDGRLTESERGELDEFERIEHFARLLKARLRRR